MGDASELRARLRGHARLAADGPALRFGLLWGVKILRAVLVAGAAKELPLDLAPRFA